MESSYISEVINAYSNELLHSSQTIGWLRILAVLLEWKDISMSFTKGTVADELNMDDQTMPDINNDCVDFKEMMGMVYFQYNIEFIISCENDLA